METKRVTILIPIDKYEKLDKIAEEEYRTISSYFLQWLDEFLKDRKTNKIKE